MTTPQNENSCRIESLTATVKQIKLVKESLENTVSSADAPKVPVTDGVQYYRAVRRNLHLLPLASKLTILQKHLNIVQPTKKVTFADLSLPVPASASSEIAATEPFSLFSPESIPLLRKAVLNEDYIARTGSIFGPKTLIVRNTAAHSPFFRHIMSDPHVLRELSKAAGVELEPVMETMELGHANVQVDFAAYAHLKDDDEKMKAAARDLCSGKYAEVPVCRKAVATRSEEQIKKELQGALLPWQSVISSFFWKLLVANSDLAWILTLGFVSP